MFICCYATFVDNGHMQEMSADQQSEVVDMQVVETATAAWGRLRCHAIICLASLNSPPLPQPPAASPVPCAV